MLTLLPALLAPGLAHGLAHGQRSPYYKFVQALPLPGFLKTMKLTSDRSYVNARASTKLSLRSLSPRLVIDSRLLGGITPFSVTLGAPALLAGVTSPDPGGGRSSIRSWEDAAGGYVSFTRLDRAGTIVYHQVTLWSKTRSEAQFRAVEARLRRMYGAPAQIIRLDREANGPIPRARRLPKTSLATGAEEAGANALIEVWGWGKGPLDAQALDGRRTRVAKTGALLRGPSVALTLSYIGVLEQSLDREGTDARRMYPGVRITFGKVL